jgi:hypothetical protein
MAKKGPSGGLKNFVTTGLVLVVLASSIIGWAKVNQINSVASGYDYFKSWSDKLWSCGAGDARLECSDGSGPNLNPGTNPGTLPGDSTKPGTTPSENSGTPGNPSESKTPNSSTSTKEASLDTLNALTISDEQTVDYQRSQWKHWIGTPCDTRESALAEQGSNITKDPATCKIISGSWVDPYSGDTFTNPGDLDIDHVIPLGYAAKHGGQDWSADKKQQFANDRSQLLAVSAKENRSKSDKGPEKYMPPRREFQCEYSKLWVSTATKYGVSVTEGDKRALKAGLQKC